MQKYAYVKDFLYKKPQDNYPTYRNIIVLKEDDFYLNGIDLQYLSFYQAHRCLRILPDNLKMGEEGIKAALKMFDFAEQAFRCFRVDRIMEMAEE